MSITRRTIFTAVPACGLAAIVPAAAAAVEAHDPLADVIIEYRAGVAALNAIPIGEITKENEDAIVYASYGQASDRIHYSTPSATSLRGVAEAIRYTLDADALVDQGCEKVLRSALAYLDGRAQS